MAESNASPRRAGLEFGPAPCKDHHDLPDTMRTALRILAILYGLFWLWSGVAKLKDPAGFSLAVRNFQLIGDPLVAMTALFIPALEIVCALAIIFKKAADGALAVIWMALLVFTVAIIISWARGLDISCGCFGTGDGSQVNYPIKIAQNLALLAVGGWLWWREHTESSASPA
jgi:putative oxidoreductase